MDYIKRKILLEESTDRNYNSPTYGTLTATSFYINVMLTQNIDDMGMFTDTTYIPNYSGITIPVNYSVLTDKLLVSGITFPFMSGITPTSVSTTNNNVLRLTGKTISDYYFITNTIVTGETESRIEDIRSYDTSDPFKVGFNVLTETYVNYSGKTINGVDRVTSTSPFTYVFGVDANDTKIGTKEQQSGLLYVDFDNPESTVISYIGEGWNETNVSLSALTKEEYLFGIISKPEVENGLFIDRGITTIFEKHLKLSEISNLDELARYGKGYFNLTT